MKNLKRAVHIDFHTMPAVWDVGKLFNPEEFANTLKEAHVEFVNVFARCNLGFAYYPTKTGVAHPSLKTDLLGGMVKACHKRGIGVSAYINLGFDHVHAVKHRDWCVITKDGRVSIKMCVNTGYGDYVLAMIREIKKLYPVDGFFLDCFGPYKCVGEECVSGMRKAGINPDDDAANLHYCYGTQMEFVEKIRKSIGPEKLLFINGFQFKDQKKLASHFEIECVPGGEWGYDTFPASVRYVRNLGKQTLGMTARFHKSWGDFGGLKSQASLDYDCYNAISNAVQCSVGDHMHPRARLDKEVYKLIGNTYGKIKALEPWTDNAVALTETAILSCAYNPSADPASNTAGVTGATRMLAELKHQFDVIDSDMSFKKYKLLVLPDDVLLDQTLAKKLDTYLKTGGKILSTGFSGLDPMKQHFAMKQWGLKYQGPEEYKVSFFSVLNPLNAGMPVIEHTIYEPGIRVRPMKGSQTLAEHVNPYFEDKKEGFHSYTYIPPDKFSGYPAVTQCGSVIHISFPVFKVYARDAVINYRTLIRNCLELLLPDPLVRVENLPSFSRVMLTIRKGMVMAHILNYCPELRGKQQVIEEPLPAVNVGLSLRKRGVKKVYTAPDRVPVEFKTESGRTSINLPVVTGYQMIVFEF